MSTKYYIQDNRIVRCSDLKSFKNTEEFLMSEVEDLERQLAEANHINTWIKKQQESWNSTTKGTIKDLECQLADEKAKSKALLAGLEVQNVDDFINRANVENYKQLGESITASFKQQLKEKG